MPKWRPKQCTICGILARPGAVISFSGYCQKCGNERMAAVVTLQKAVGQKNWSLVKECADRLEVMDGGGRVGGGRNTMPPGSNRRANTTPPRPVTVNDAVSAQAETPKRRRPA